MYIDKQGQEWIEYKQDYIHYKNGYQSVDKLPIYRKYCPKRDGTDPDGCGCIVLVLLLFFIGVISLVVILTELNQQEVKSVEYHLEQERRNKTWKKENK